MFGKVVLTCFLMNFFSEKTYSTFHWNLWIAVSFLLLYVGKSESTVNFVLEIPRSKYINSQTDTAWRHSIITQGIGLIFLEHLWGRLFNLSRALERHIVNIYSTYLMTFIKFFRKTSCLSFSRLLPSKPFNTTNFKP